MAVLPPTDASTAPRRVVGMLMYGIPRLNVAAAKPPRSVTTPPPRFMMIDLRVTSPSASPVHTCFNPSRFLLMSSLLMVIMRALAAVRLSACRRGSTRRKVLVSVMIVALAASSPSTRLSRALPTALVKISFCSIILQEQDSQCFGTFLHGIEFEVGSGCFKCSGRERACIDSYGEKTCARRGLHT